MSSSALFKLRYARSFSKLYLRSFQSVRHCASQPLLKSENENILQLIEQQETKDFDKRAHKHKNDIQIFAHRRKEELTQIVKEEKDSYHPVLFSILSAQSAPEILNILSTLNLNDYSHEEIVEDPVKKDGEKNMTPSIHRMHCKAIRCCADLNEMDVCWQIFEKCKKDNLISNELYNTMMWVSMYKERSVSSLRKVFLLHDELQDIISRNKLSISLHPRTYSTLLNSCLKARDYAKALAVISDLEKNKPEILKYFRVKQAMTRIYAKLNEIDKCIQLLEEMVDEHDIDWDDAEELGTFDVLRAIAFCARRNKINPTGYIEKAESLFKRSVAAALKKDNEVHSGLIHGMAYVYSNIGDYESCHDLLKIMVSKAEKYKLFPAPMTCTFHDLFRALANAKVSDNEDFNFEEVGKLLKVMDKLEVPKTALLFCEILRVFKNDIEKARAMYQKMLDDDIEPNMPVLRELFSIGEEQYERGTEEKTKFVKWIIEQYQKYDIVPTEDIKYRWKRALD